MGPALPLQELYYQGQKDLLSPPERIRADILRGFCEAEETPSQVQASGKGWRG